MQPWFFMLIFLRTFLSALSTARGCIFEMNIEQQLARRWEKIGAGHGSGVCLFEYDLLVVMG